MNGRKSTVNSWKKAVSHSQDWSKPERVIKQARRSTAARTQIERGKSKSAAWLAEQLQQAVKPQE